MNERMVNKVRVMLFIITAIALTSTVSAYNQTTISFIENHTILDIPETQTFTYEIPAYQQDVTISGDMSLTGSISVPAHNITMTFPPIQVVSNPIGNDLQFQILTLIAFCCSLTTLINVIIFVGWLKGQLTVRKSEV